VLFPPQLVSGLAVCNISDPKEVVLQVTDTQVVQGYAQVLQQSLGRTSSNSFDLAGLKLYTDLKAIEQSLARCLQQYQDPFLKLWYQTLTDILPNYQNPFASIAMAQTWLDDIRSSLEVAPLPTKEAQGIGGDEVARQLGHILGGLYTIENLSPEINSFRNHLRYLSERYWNGLFVCYDVIGVPRTNNDLESLFGDTRRRVRRQSGFKQLRRSLLRQGAWLLYRPQQSPLELQQQLQTVSRSAYRKERIRFQQRQESFRSRYRWQRNSDTVLTNLEIQWQQAQRANFT
jgi:hypothetical protein